MGSEKFYSKMKAYTSLHEVLSTGLTYPVPDEWYVAVTDIVSSTQHVQDGKYREVNFVGAASIAAIMNIDKTIQIPFLFGGDGAIILVPPTLKQEAENVLSDTICLAKEEYQLELRAKIFSVKELRKENKKLQVAKVNISDSYDQAVLLGGGFAYAEELLKKGHDLIQAKKTQTAKYDGLECRWKPIQTRHEEITTYIIQAQTSTQTDMYAEILEKIDDVYGEEHNPVYKEGLAFTLRKVNMKMENSLKQNTWIQQLRIRFVTFLGFLYWKVTRRGTETKWNAYLKQLLANTDYQKFDDMLRFVLSGTKKQREEFTAYLEDKRKQGQIYYGVQSASHALMTCLVFEHFGKQVHFIDGANGGYTLAAQMIKQQKEENSSTIQI